MTRKDNKECGRTQKETMNIETKKVRESWLCEANACCKLCVKDYRNQWGRTAPVISTGCGPVMFTKHRLRPLGPSPHCPLPVPAPLF